MSQKESRREFLKTVTTVGAAALTIPVLKSHAKMQKNAGQSVILCTRGESIGKEITQPGWDVLAEGGNVLDAVEKSANTAELNPDDLSVGFGSIPDETGSIKLDASVMYGPEFRCGAVASLEHIKTPSSVARKVMERTNHILLSGAGALQFAQIHGFQKENLYTDRARSEWLRRKEYSNETDNWLPPTDDIRHSEYLVGTINILGVDRDGNLAGMNSTGGTVGKMAGRIGSAAIIGAGLYVDNDVGVAAASGRGEELIRSCGSYLVVEMMRQGMPPQKACEEACLKIIRINGGNEKVRQSGYNVMLCALGKNGQPGCASLRRVKDQKPYISLIDSTGFHIYSGINIIEA